MALMKYGDHYAGQNIESHACMRGILANLYSRQNF